jgi:hypothetical protein
MVIQVGYSEAPQLQLSCGRFTAEYDGRYMYIYSILVVIVLVGFGLG